MIDKNQPTLEEASKWRAFDTMWALGCFGTAIGAGVLFFPIKASVGGLIPLICIILIAYPIAYFSHKALARFVLSGTGGKKQDITGVVEEHFGHSGGTAITFLYFIAIWPLLWLYGVAVTNTIISFSEHQLALGSPNRAIVSLVCILVLAFIIFFGRDIVVKVMSYLVYPFIAALVVIALCLVPYWTTDIFTEAANTSISFGGSSGILMTIAGGISIMVFSFNHSPIISSFSVANREEYGHLGNDFVEKKVCKTEGIASWLMFVVVIFFAVSCALTLSPSKMMDAKAQNIPILSYLANYFTAGNDSATTLAIFFQWAAPIIAIVAIFKSFFGHYLGTFEGLNGLVLRVCGKKEQEVNMKVLNTFSMIFIMGSTWFVAWLNPSVLELIDALGAPLIAMLLCILPMYAFHRVPALNKYKGKTDWWVTFIGLVTIILSVRTIFVQWIL